jgi:hypothetical protein
MTNNFEKCCDCHMEFKFTDMKPVWNLRFPSDPKYICKTCAPEDPRVFKRKEKNGTSTASGTA